MPTERAANRLQESTNNAVSTSSHLPRVGWIDRIVRPGFNKRLLLTVCGYFVSLLSDLSRSSSMLGLFIEGLILIAILTVLTGKDFVGHGFFGYI